MPRLSRTTRDRVLSDILKRLGPLTNKDLADEAENYPVFKGMSGYSVQKAITRFLKDFEELEIVTRDRGKIVWLPVDTESQKGPTVAKVGEPKGPTLARTQRDTVLWLIQGIANGSISFRDKPLQKELKGMKGEIYDELMGEIYEYNKFRTTPLISDTLEKRIFDTALKLRAYGFLEVKEPLAADGKD